MARLRFLMFSIALGLVCLAASQGSAQAACRLDSSDGDDDVVICDGTPDEDGIDTQRGNDMITVLEGAEVRGVESAIITGSGGDSVTNYGTIHAGKFAVDLGRGNDFFHNFGMLETQDGGIWCAPAVGHVCRVINASSGTITAPQEVIDGGSKGGGFLVLNYGTIISTEEEAVHLNSGISNIVNNHGTLQGADSAIEVFGGDARIINMGTIESKHETTIDLHAGNDLLSNWGRIISGTLPAIRAGDGNDVITNWGSITARNESRQDAAIAAEGGDDRITLQGEVAETGSGHAVVEAGFGSDTVTIKGGMIIGLVNGDDFTGSELGDHDVLIFALSGS